jgi:putative protease
MLKKPELLSPAGSVKSLRFAFAYGSDAVYCGQPRYSLRVRNNEFDLDHLAQGIDIAHAQNKKLFVVSNLSPHNDKVRSYLRDIEPVIDLKPDALIMSDPGLIMMVREKFPDITIHLSVQANAVNYATVQFWQKFGLSRVILSRELSLEEIGDIKQKCPEMELEVFVHGALCIAYSGRCLLSGYITKRDANQGACTNTCRWKYQAHDAVELASGDVVAKNPADLKPAVQTFDPKKIVLEGQSDVESIEKQIFLLQEESRPGEYMPAYEDEHGTYIMNSKDLRAVQHVKQLMEMGIDSLKIEGRTKSHYYVARTAQIYRQAIDLAAEGKSNDFTLMRELDKLASRGYTEGFYRRHPPSEYQNYNDGASKSQDQLFVGEVLDYNPQNHTVLIDAKNRFAVGDSVEIMTPQGNTTFTINQLENSKGQSVEVASGSGHQVRLALPEGVNPNEFSLLMRNL